jgi:hypothetical protein
VRHVTSWGEVERSAPDLARRVRELFDAGRHKTIATLRADGSPRISGIECEFVDGELRFGSMPGARKGADLHRDPRFALHGPTVHPEEGNESEWPGEAKIAGRAVPAGRVTAGGGEEATDGEQFTTQLAARLRGGGKYSSSSVMRTSSTPLAGARRAITASTSSSGPRRRR